MMSVQISRRSKITSYNKRTLYDIQVKYYILYFVSNRHTFPKERRLRKSSRMSTVKTRKRKRFKMNNL